MTEFDGKAHPLQRSLRLAGGVGGLGNSRTQGAGGRPHGPPVGREFPFAVAHTANCRMMIAWQL